MKSTWKVFAVLIAALGVVFIRAGSATATDGSVKLGYTYTDEEGNLGVYQPTFNLYEGVAVSLEDFAHEFANGLRVRGSLHNITLNNRRANATVGTRNLFGVDLTGAQYRRTYSFAGDRSTRRDQWSGQGWVKPLPQVKLYGGYGLVSRKGTAVEWFEPGLFASPQAVQSIDYDQHRYHAGVQANHEGSMLQAEMRRSDYRDQRVAANDRQTTRYRVVSVTPLPRYRSLVLNAGFQHFRNEITDAGRKLSANTVWGGERLFLPAGFTAKYSFVFDRATNAGDRAATDDITNAVYLGKTWTRRAGVAIGFQRRQHDDIADEVQGNGYYAAGWVKPIAAWTVKGEFGAQQDEVKQGVTLTGDEDRSRIGLTSQYEHRLGSVRLRYENRQRTNDDIGTAVDFQRVSGEITVVEGIPGRLSGSYAVAFGDYETTDQGFAFRDHILGGAWESPVFHKLQAEVDGTYYRSQRDLDVESFSLRTVARYWFREEYHLEIGYRAHNFDDLLARDRYYTANIVNVSIVKKL